MSPAVQALLALAEAERVLVDEDPAARSEELAELAERREQIMSMLPETFADEDRDAVVRALEMQVDSTKRMWAARDALADTLKRVDLGRRTARGYAPAGLPAEGSLSLRG
jgi:hypothetical protein